MRHKNRDFRWVIYTFYDHRPQMIRLRPSQFRRIKHGPKGRRRRRRRLENLSFFLVFIHRLLNSIGRWRGHHLSAGISRNALPINRKESAIVVVVVKRWERHKKAKPGNICPRQSFPRGILSLPCVRHNFFLSLSLAASSDPPFRKGINLYRFNWKSVFKMREKRTDPSFHRMTSRGWLPCQHNDTRIGPRDLVPKKGTIKWKGFQLNRKYSLHRSREYYRLH